MNYHLIPCRAELDTRSPTHYTKHDLFTRHLISTLTLTAAYECPLHDPQTPCSCLAALSTLSTQTKELFIYIHFVLTWEQWLLSTPAAFIFRNTYLGKKGFLAIESFSAETFAVHFAEWIFSTPTILAPAANNNLENVIGAMLSFWDNRATTWSKIYPNREAAYRNLGACLPEDLGHELYGQELQEKPAAQQHPPLHHLGKDLLFTQRFDRTASGEKGHRMTVFLLPLVPRLGNNCVYVRHKLLGVRRCHEDCGRELPELKQETIEQFRKSRFRGQMKVVWPFDELQQSVLEVRYDDPVDGFS